VLIAHKLNDAPFQIEKPVVKYNPVLCFWLKCYCFGHFVLLLAIFLHFEYDRLQMSYTECTMKVAFFILTMQCFSAFFDNRFLSLLVPFLCDHLVSFSSFPLGRPSLFSLHSFSLLSLLQTIRPILLFTITFQLPYLSYPYPSFQFLRVLSRDCSMLRCSPILCLSRDGSHRSRTQSSLHDHRFFLLSSPPYRL
jgi:hypothetical protein